MTLRQGTTNSIPKKDCNQDIHILEAGESDPVYFFVVSSHKDEAAIVKATSHRTQVGHVVLVGTKAQARFEWKSLVGKGYKCFAQEIAKVAS